MADFRFFRLDRRGPLAWATIDRPEDRNAVNSAVMAELKDLLDQVEAEAQADESLRALVLTGGGTEYFIGGADGAEMMLCDPEGALAFSRRIQAAYDRLEASPLITAAAINGLCFGGGFELALCCDFRVAATTARIGLPEVKVGLIPGGGGTQRLPRLIGFGAAKEMILSGRLLKGQEAFDRGLVQAVVEPEDLAAGVEAVLKPVLARPAYAVSLAKRAVNAGLNMSSAEGQAAESELFSRCFEHDFFPELMIKQLRDGSLKTSADINQIIAGVKK